MAIRGWERDEGYEHGGGVHGGREHHIEPTFHFSYGPIDSLEPLPGLGMYLVYGAMMVTGVLIAIGRWCRWAAVAFFVLTTYGFLLDATF